MSEIKLRFTLRQATRRPFYILAVACAVVVMGLLVVATVRWIELRIQDCRDLSAMSWFHSYVREEMPRYYEIYGLYPTNLEAILFRNYGYRPSYGDGFTTNMMARMGYATDGRNYTLTWNTPQGRRVVLSGKEGRTTSDNW